MFFAYGARLSNSNNNSVESFRVNVDGLEHSLIVHVVGDWRTHTDRFVADGDTATLTFTSVSQHKWTYGNFIDDVRISAVPEPGSSILLAIGLLV